MRAFLVVLGCVLAGCLSLSPETIEPALRAAVLDPVVLGRICDAAPEDVGPPSASALTLSNITNERSMGGSGSGTAQVTYVPVGGARAGTACHASVRFEIDDGGGEKVTAGTIRVHALQVVGQ